MLYFILFSLIRITCDRLDGTRGTRVRPRERQGKHAQSQGTPPAQPPTPPIHTPPKRPNPHPAATTRSHTGTPWPWFHSSALVSDDSVGRVWRLALPFFFSSFLPFFLLLSFDRSVASHQASMGCAPPAAALGLTVLNMYWSSYSMRNCVDRLTSTKSV